MVWMEVSCLVTVEDLLSFLLLSVVVGLSLKEGMNEDQVGHTHHHRHHYRHF